MAYPLTCQPRDPYDWSLARPGEEFHIGAMIQHPPEHLDLHVSGYATVPLQIRFEETRQARMEAARCTMIGIAASACLMVLAITAFAGAAIRLPAIEQQLADNARI